MPKAGAQPLPPARRGVLKEGNAVKKEAAEKDATAGADPRVVVGATASPAPSMMSRAILM
jgi:hypothetical protein